MSQHPPPTDAPARISIDIQSCLYIFVLLRTSFAIDHSGKPQDLRASWQERSLNIRYPAGKTTEAAARRGRREETKDGGHTSGPGRERRRRAGGGGDRREGRV